MTEPSPIEKTNSGFVADATWIFFHPCYVFLFLFNYANKFNSEDNDTPTGNRPGAALRKLWASSSSSDSPDVLRVLVALRSVFTGAALGELLPDVGA